MTSSTKVRWFLNLVTLLLVLATPLFARTETFTAAHVCDGDTIILSNQQHVRYIGINAPEIAHDMKPAEYFGHEARECNKQLVLGKRIRLEFDRERQDRHGRTLAYVYLEDGTFVNVELVRAGCAHVLYAPQNVKYYASLLTLQREAIEAQKGMWPHILAASQKPYTGNARSKKFHRPTCSFGQRTSTKNVTQFKTKKEAFMKGYSPCRKCLP
ncbi:MAG: thermonuclease family protein [Deltaproteobacteria bacterium]|nr:thermonuclease family protein [Deltaproteobacteria bacterium]